MTETTPNHRDNDATMINVHAGTGSVLSSLVADVATIGTVVIAFVGLPERL